MINMACARRPQQSTATFRGTRRRPYQGQPESTGRRRRSSAFRASSGPRSGVPGMGRPLGSARPRPSSQQLDDAWCLRGLAAATVGRSSESVETSRAHLLKVVNCLLARARDGRWRAGRPNHLPRQGWREPGWLQRARRPAACDLGLRGLIAAVNTPKRVPGGVEASMLTCEADFGNTLMARTSSLWLARQVRRFAPSGGACPRFAAGRCASGRG